LAKDNTHIHALESHMTTC